MLIPLSILYVFSSTTVTDAKVLPVTFVSGQSITAHYTVVGGSEVAYQLRWYKNERYVKLFDDRKTITVSDTARGDSWFFLIIVSDGTSWTASVQSAVSTVINQPPLLPERVIIIPQHPLEQVDNLTVFAFGAFDPDGDFIHYNRYWSKNGVEQVAYRNKREIPRTEVLVEDIWSVRVTVADCEDENPDSVSDQVVVGESVPRRENMVNHLSDYYATSSKSTGYYNILKGYGDLMEDVDAEVIATERDLDLDLCRDFRLFDVFGALLGVGKQESWYRDDYVFMLKVLYEVYSQVGTTLWAAEQASRVALGVAVHILEHYRYAGWILGENTLGIGTLTITGNFNWSSLFSGGSDFNAVYTNGVFLWIVGDGGVVATFDQTTLTEEVVAVEDLYSIDGCGEYLWAVGAGGTILRKFPGDSSFTAVVSSVAVDLYGIAIWGVNNALAVGAGGTILRYNGAWASEASPTVQNLRDVTFESASIAYAVGDAGVILKYDGGWALLISPTVENLHTCTYDFSNSTLLIGGDNGVVLRSTDGGVTFWDIGTASLGVVYDLEKTEYKIFALTSTGLWEYEDSWNTLTTADAPVAFAFSGGIGWAVGTGGLILRYNGHSPGYTGPTKTYEDGELVNRVILESRKGRRHTIDALIWEENPLFFHLFESIIPAHLLVNYIRESTYLRDYYPYLLPDVYKRDGERGILRNTALPYAYAINARTYGESEMLRKTIPEDAAFAPSIT